QSGQSAKAREAFERVATERPDEWQAIYNLAIVDGEMKNYADARVQLAKLKQIRPNDPEGMKLEQALAAVRGAVHHGHMQPVCRGCTTPPPPSAPSPHFVGRGPMTCAFSDH